MLVAAARHVEPSLTPVSAADRIADNDLAYAAVKAVVDEKMRTAGHDRTTIQRCIVRLDALRDAWVEIADKQTKNGDSFFYANEEPVRRLLQDPFGLRTNMSANRAWFIAARSMRDTEPVSLLKIRKPRR